MLAADSDSESARNYVKSMVGVIILERILIDPPITIGRTSSVSCEFSGGSL